MSNGQVRQKNGRLCLEVCQLNKNDLNSLDFVINRFLMKLFKTNDINIVKTCQSLFSFDLPSVVIEKRAIKFKDGLSCRVSKMYSNQVWLIFCVYFA